MRLWKRTRKDTGQDMSTASAARPDTVPAVPSDTDKDLWWVQILLNVGRPVVAVFVLVMCAPGEHFLALEARFIGWLAWGMPGTLTAYAGIAAVVATKRPKDAPGRKTAVWGAITSIAIAMTAQPIAHLYGRFGEPSQAQQIWLTVVVSCIPALVFGHLLHMAASAVRVRVSTPVVLDIAPDTSRLEAALEDTRDKLSTPDPLSLAVSAFNTEGTRTREEVMSEWTAAREARTSSVDTALFEDAATWTPGQDTTRPGWTAREVSGETVSVRDTDIPELSWEQAVVQINRPGVPAVVRAVLTADRTATDKDIREAIRVQLGPDIPQNTIYKGIARTRKTMDIPAIKEA
jgi:hypothetical protein